MPTVQTLIGNRFEAILQRLYPELVHVKDDINVVPDFEHPLFFAEAKACFEQPDYTAHIKQYQVEEFKKLTLKKPVVYLIGFHDFANSMTRLSTQSTSQKEAMLEREMNVSRFYIVDSAIINHIWQRRNCVSRRGHIHYCTLREGHLNHIIQDSEITVLGIKYRARDYYGVSQESYSFSPAEYESSKKLSIGHIMPLNEQKIVDFFHR